MTTDNRADNGPEMLEQVRTHRIAMTKDGLGVSMTGRAANIIWLPRRMVLAINHPEPDFPEVIDITVPHWLAVRSKLVPPAVVMGWGQS